MKIALRGGGYKEIDKAGVDRRKGKKMSEEQATEEQAQDSNLVALSGAPRGVEILTTDESEANKVHLRLLELRRVYEDTYFEIARLLHKVSSEKLYMAKSLGGYSSFDEYVESELEFKRRKAHMLTALWNWFGIEHGSNRKLINGAVEIGWSKAYQLVEVVDDKNADEWFGLAKEKDLAEFTQYVRTALKKKGVKRRSRGKDQAQKEEPIKLKVVPGMNPELPEDAEGVELDNGETSEPSEPEPKEAPKTGIEIPTDEEVSEVKGSDKEWASQNFRVPQDTVETIQDALKWAKRIGKTKHDGYAISLICQHFLTFAHDKSTVMYGVWLQRFERVTGLKVIAIDPEEEKVIYGREHLEDKNEDQT